MINARAETITDKPSYRRFIATKHCRIPDAGFYEWRNLREGEARLLMKTECQLLAYCSSMLGQTRLRSDQSRL